MPPTRAQITESYTESVAEAINGSATAAGAAHDTWDDQGVNGDRPGVWDKFRAEIFADQAGTLAIQHSRDGTTWRIIGAATVTTASVGLILEVLVVRRYVRAVWTNTAGSATTICELDTLLLSI